MTTLRPIVGYECQECGEWRFAHRPVPSRCGPCRRSAPGGQSGLGDY